LNETLGVWHCQLGVSENITPVKLFSSGEAESFNDNSALPFKRKDIISRKTRRGFVIEIPIKNSEDFYGFGLQFHSFNHSGRRRFLKVNSDPVCNTGESHGPVPFYVSSAGYGLFVDTFRYVTFFLGTNGEKGSSKRINEPSSKVHEEFSEQALYALKRAKNKRRLIIEIPNSDGGGLYFFEGPLMIDAVRRYNLFSGGGCLPPLWGLGNWYRMYGGADQEHVTKMAEYFRQNQIPISVIGLEPGWHSHSYSCSYKWNAGLFPKPDELIKRLSQYAYRVNLWEHAFVHPDAELYKKLEGKSGDYEVWDGLVPDFADSKAQEIFGGFHGKNFVDKGISGFKLDECDNSDFNSSSWSFPEVSSFPSGMDGEQMHSAFGLLYQKTIEKAFRDRNIRTFGEARSSGALAASSPFVLYSDLYDHRQFIRALANSGFSGLLWSPEVRSCVDVEDFIRRLQTVIFSPQALLNCWRIPNPPWFQTDIKKNLADEQMPQSGEITVLARKYLELRMRFIPYLYSSFWRYRLEGLPPVRALVLDYEKDERTHSIDDEYMFGDSLLVAPLLRGQSSREVYLPGGDWYDFWAHEKYTGNKSFTINAAIDIIPLFVKSGVILPLAEPLQHITDDATFDITAYCFGGGGKKFTLYEDDGATLAHEKGKYNTLTLSQDAEGKVNVTRQGIEKPRYSIKEWVFID